LAETFHRAVVVVIDRRRNGYGEHPRVPRGGCGRNVGELDSKWHALFCAEVAMRIDRNSRCGSAVVRRRIWYRQLPSTRHVAARTRRNAALATDRNTHRRVFNGRAPAAAVGIAAVNAVKFCRGCRARRARNSAITYRAPHTLDERARCAHREVDGTTSTTVERAVARSDDPRRDRGERSHTHWAKRDRGQGAVDGCRRSVQRHILNAVTIFYAVADKSLCSMVIVSVVGIRIPVVSIAPTK
jgi:hypothetical protein